MAGKGLLHLCPFLSICLHAGPPPSAILSPHLPLRFKLLELIAPSSEQVYPHSLCFHRVSNKPSESRKINANIIASVSECENQYEFKRESWFLFWIDLESCLGWIHRISCSYQLWHTLLFFCSGNGPQDMSPSFQVLCFAGRLLNISQCAS